MTFDPEIDRKRARLSEAARCAVRADSRRIVIVGANGWIGRTTLALLQEALGPVEFSERVACFGSREGDVELDGGQAVPQHTLSRLEDLECRPTMLLHLAFLTKDKVSSMDTDAYVSANRALSRLVLNALDPIGVDRLFVASSGAAAFADNPAAAADLRLYGRLKRDDEELFAAWARAAPNRRRAALGRIYSVSGPYINKHETYALASFILDALAGRPIGVRAPMRVLRSYVAVRELVSLVLAALLAEDGSPELRFDTGGEMLELGEVATRVAHLIGGEVLRRPVTDPLENRYVGDEEGWRQLLGKFQMEPLSLSDQVAETAAYLARQAGRGQQ